MFNLLMPFLLMHVTLALCKGRANGMCGLKHPVQTTFSTFLMLLLHVDLLLCLVVPFSIFLSCAAFFSLFAICSKDDLQSLLSSTLQTCIGYSGLFNSELLLLYSYLNYMPFSAIVESLRTSLIQGLFILEACPGFKFTNTPPFQSLYNMKMV